MQTEPIPDASSPAEIGKQLKKLTLSSKKTLLILLTQITKITAGQSAEGKMRIEGGAYMIRNRSLPYRDALRKHFGTFWQYYLMLLPGAFFFILFKYLPLAGCTIAFQDYSIARGITESPWVGLKHFSTLFRSPDFSRVFTNTLILGIYKIVFVFPVSILLAVLMNEIRSGRLKKTVQTAVYIPYFISWVVVSGMIFDLLGKNGLYNVLRAMMNQKSVLLMQRESAFRTIYVLSSIWKDAGWGTVVYLAAISGIDPSLYESAVIDGANRPQQMRYITLPLLVPTILTLFLLNIGSFMETGFDHVFNLLTPMTYSVGDVFDTYIYRAGIQQAQYSYTTAVGLFQSVISFALVFTFNRLSRKTESGGLW